MDIVIVGGGTAGWSSAYGFSAMFGEQYGKPKNFNVTIIDSSHIPPIGVGESTLPEINKFHNKFGSINPENYNCVRNCNGTAKTGSQFNNFKKGRDWFFPYHTKEDTISLVYDEYLNKPYIEDYYDRHCKFKKDEPIPPLTYYGNISYHIDASKYQQFLKDLVLTRPNVTYIQSAVDKVVLNKEGAVDKLILDNNKELKADLYIDCTGFKSVLRSKMPGSSWDSFSDSLLTNQAFVYSLPYIDEKKQSLNKTTATAMNAGWIWHVPLGDCIRFGYVHSNNHISNEDAKKELREFLIKNQGYAESDFDNLEPRFVQFKTGSVNEAWHKNVLAVGLSSSFIEPLGSQGMYLFQLTIMEAFDLLTKKQMLDDLKDDFEKQGIDISITPRFRTLPTIPYMFEGEIKAFNKSIKDSTYNMKEAMEMFFRLSDREDTQFWKDIKQPLSEEQQELVDICSQDDPSKLMVKYNKYTSRPFFKKIDLIIFINLFKGKKLK